MRSQTVEVLFEMDPDVVPVCVNSDIVGLLLWAIIELVGVLVRGKIGSCVVMLEIEKDLVGELFCGVIEPAG